MTDSQRRRFYGPNWRRAAVVLGWEMKDGRLASARLPQHGHPTANGLYQQVWDRAEELALLDHRAVTDVDLRHAVNLVACRAVSSKHFTNAQVNRVVALMRLLAEPDNLTLMMEWLDPNLAAKRGLIEKVKGLATSGYVSSICQSRFKTTDLSDLDAYQLVQLIATLNSRVRSKQGAL